MMSFRWSAVKPYRQCPGCYAVCIPYQFECPRCEHHPFRAKYSDSHSGEGAHMIHHLAVVRFLMFAIVDCGVRSSKRRSPKIALCTRCLTAPVCSLPDSYHVCYSNDTVSNVCLTPIGDGFSICIESAVLSIAIGGDQSSMFYSRILCVMA